MIETLDDVMESIADWAGIYGSHADRSSDKCNCRMCFTMLFKDRIRQAIRIERQLERGAH